MVVLQDAEGKTPLHVAIQNQRPSIIALLLCHPNIDLTIRDKAGLTPFATALTYRNNKAAQAILDKLPTAAEQVRCDWIKNVRNKGRVQHLPDIIIAYRNLRKDKICI